MLGLILLTLRLGATPPAGPAFLVHAGDREELVSPDRLARVRMLFDPAESPDTPAYMGLATFLPGGSVGEHVHERSAELVYVLRGSGTMTLDDRTMPVTAGDAIRVPPGARHSFRNDGKEPLEALQLYVPPGPEARFKLWPPALAEPGAPPGSSSR